MRYIQDIKFFMLQVCDNEISLREWSGGTAQLRTLEETLALDSGHDNDDMRNALSKIEPCVEDVVSSYETSISPVALK